MTIFRLSSFFLCTIYCQYLAASNYGFSWNVTITPVLEKKRQRSYFYCHISARNKYSWRWLNIRYEMRKIPSNYNHRGDIALEVH